MSDFPLWSDEPSNLDLLAFRAVADTAVEAVLDDALDPLAIGISGSWGSGKTTVLKLIGEGLTTHSSVAGSAKVLILETDPWRYDPAVGAKESLIGEVLTCLQDALEENATAAQGALDKLKKLAKRVDWAKALSIAARASLTLTLPSVDDITQLVKSDEGGKSESRGLEEFRAEFAVLMGSSELSHIRRLVVLVDDLDRCLPETVVETLEAIRLFLAVPKMSFVIAADEQRVADAIRTRFPESRGGVPAPQAAGAAPEEPAKLYLHKIVQTTVPVPTLSRFDTEAYLILLQLMTRLSAADLRPYVEKCDELRRASGSTEDVAAAGVGDISPEMLVASRLTPILYEKLRGNPRRVKRFLNDIRVRQSIAFRRGINLDAEVVAKLMVLEQLVTTGFEQVLGWLAEGRLREQVAALEQAAGRRSTDEMETPAVNGSSQRQQGSSREHRSAEAEPTRAEFSEELIRWAKLQPSLTSIDLTPYLSLAASITGKALLDSGLPERLRDIAFNLLSGVRTQERAVTAADLSSLTTQDATTLMSHLGRAARDRPTEQTAAIQGMLRLARTHAGTVTSAVNLFRAIPAGEVQPAVPLLFTEGDLGSFRGVLDQWNAGATGPTKRALERALGGRS